MNILIMIPSLYPIGGAEMLVYNLARFYSRSNDVLLVSLYNKKKGFLLENLRDEGVRVVFLNKKRGIDLKCSKQFKKIVYDFSPDIIHAHLHVGTTIVTSGILRKYKGRVVYTFHSFVDKKVLGNVLKPKNLLHKYLFKRGIFVPVAISNIIQQSACNFYKLSNSQVNVVYNGVDVNKFYNSVPFLERENDFIFVGRFIKIKRPDFILESFIHLIRANPNLKTRLIMLGAGSMLEKCIDMSRGYENINILGAVSNVDEYLKKSKFLLLASEYEGNPIVINEAIASGTYVISTEVGGVPDIVNNDNGILFSVDSSIEYFSELLKNCLNNQNEINNVLLDKYKKNCSKISIETTVNEYLNLFKKICKNRG